MALEEKDRELAAIGASIGALCRPCIEHHIPAGRKAGLSGPELAQAVEIAQATHRIATELLFRRSRELLTGEASAGAAAAAEPTSRLGELVALGASIGANCHPLLEQHVAGALQQGLTASQVRSAIKMAEIVQQHAAEITAGKAAAALGPAARRFGPAIHQCAMTKCHQMMSKCGEMFSQQAGSPAGMACTSTTTPGPEPAAAGKHEPAEAARAS